MAEKIIFPALRNSRTRIGVIPRKSEFKTVTIKSKSGEVKRLKLNIAQELVNSGEWYFCPKSEYKRK